MLVSTRGRYALRVLTELAENDSEGYIPLNTIAERQGISEKYLEAILKSLVREKVLEGVRGKGGGYRLARPASEIPVGQVLRLTEPCLSTVSCLSDGGTCPRAEACRTLPLWHELDETILNFLDSRTLADLAVKKQNSD